VSFIGAVGALGFYVDYFLDPELGPHRRREVVGAVQGAATVAWRISQDFVARFVEPSLPAASPVAPPRIPGPPVEARAEQRIVEPVVEAPEQEQEQEPAADLAGTLHDEVTFFTVGEDPPELDDPEAVAVAAPRPEAIMVAETAVNEPPRHAVTPPPEPRIIAYDAADSTIEPAPPAAAEAGAGCSSLRWSRRCSRQRPCSARGRSGATTTAAPRRRPRLRVPPRRSSSSASQAPGASRWAARTARWCSSRHRTGEPC
jgi:hypothetical protein